MESGLLWSKQLLKQCEKLQQGPALPARLLATPVAQEVYKPLLLSPPPPATANA